MAVYCFSSGYTKMKDCVAAFKSPWRKGERDELAFYRRRRADFIC